MATSSMASGAVDRVEAIARPEGSRPVLPVPGVELRSMVDAPRGARGLFTGVLALAPGASMPYDARPTPDALVVLEGAAIVDVEDRRYAAALPFDESITIVEGTATCVVEGRRHELAGLATAMVPQGRCHDFINLTLERMAMVWVYAGNSPDRIVVGEHLCHPEKARGAR